MALQNGRFYASTEFLRSTAVQQATAPPEKEWFPVLEGKPIGDAQIGQVLFADKETVIGWRDRLESLGLIRLTPVPDKDALGLPSHKYEVLNLNFGVQKPETPLASQSVNLLSPCGPTPPAPLRWL